MIKLATILNDSGVSFKVDDSSTPIGRRYARADELGVPFAIVVDFQSVKDNTITIRERDTTQPQIRVKVHFFFFFFS